MDLLRCYSCRKLLLESEVLKVGFCKCGSRKVTDALPTNLFEELKVLWWRLCGKG